MSTFAVPVKTSKTRMDLNTTNNIVNPQWELIDPLPDIHNLFHGFNFKFFNGKLSCVELEWSKRMYQCAGICYSRKNCRQMSCIIRLSEPLLKLRSRKELIETLLHEMIHAFNFIRGICEENGGHGRNFISKMNEINGLAGTNITVYHSFHDEVQLYKKHWWRCDGKCKNQKPYYGFVKRTCNRAPGANDFWWNQHLHNCGGQFIKVKEPEKAEKKPKEKKEPAKAKNLIDKYFPPEMSPIRKSVTVPKINAGASTSTVAKPSVSVKKEVGNKLGGSQAGKSRLLDDYFVKKEPENSPFKKPKLEVKTEPKIKSEHPILRKSIKMEIMQEFDDSDDIILIDDEFDDAIVIDQELATVNIKIEPKQEFNDSTCNCPICNDKVDTNQINQHLDECLTMQTLANISGT